MVLGLLSALSWLLFGCDDVGVSDGVGIAVVVIILRLGCCWVYAADNVGGRCIYGGVVYDGAVVVVFVDYDMVVGISVDVVVIYYFFFFFFFLLCCYYY